MENSFFIFTDKEEIVIERFHICTWEFKSSKPLIEFGAEISKNSIKDKDSLCLSIYIPWLTDKCEISDLYENLKERENARFIFNDSIEGDVSLDSSTDDVGVIHKFQNKESLCILPIKKTIKSKIISVLIDLKPYKQGCKNIKINPNIYFRFLIKPVEKITMIKKGIGKSTIIYDIKVNERRNISSNEEKNLRDKAFCKIKNCFLFNIIPNEYDVVFFENKSLKNIRALEYESFKKYLLDSRVKKDELIVVFNKKDSVEQSPSYSFFTIYSRERIGTGQFAIAILINILCGFFLTLPGYRKALTKDQDPLMIWEWFTWELYLVLALFIVSVLLLYPPKWLKWILNKININI
jgi:hypothetical protein